jgi:hypothetical protein
VGAIDLDGVLNWLQPVCQRWLAQRAALLADRRYAEVKAEDLAVHWPDARRRLFERLGLPDAETSSTFSVSRLTSWRGEPGDAGQAEIVSRLGWAAQEPGYQATTVSRGSLICGARKCLIWCSTSAHQAAALPTAQMGLQSSVMR